MRLYTGLALALVAAGWALTLWVEPWSDETVNDLFVYRSFAGPALDGALPYRELFFEYPPLAAPAIALPGLFGTGAEEFRLAFAVWTLLLGAAVVLLCGALAARSGGDRRRALFAAALLPVLCGALVRTHFDLAPVALTLAALLLVCAARPRAGLALLGVAAMTKGFPLVVAPVALAWLVGRGMRREAWQGAAACAAVMTAIAGLALVASPQGALEALRFQLERPVQIESVPAMGLLALDGAGAGEAVATVSHRSDGLAHEASNALSVAGLAAMLGAVALAAALAYRSPGRRSLVIAALAAVTASAALGKVLSPQFVIWVAPLGALAFAWRMPVLAATVLAALVLTQLEFPAHYFDVVEREPLALALVATRDLTLLGVLALALWSLALQLSRQEDLLDRRRPAVATGLD